MKKVELLSPAGTLKNLHYAFAYGADAVYAGQPRYSLRVRNNDFNFENLKSGIEYAHNLNKKLYVVANIQPHNAKIKTFLEDLKPVVDLKPDALIMSDLGMISMVRERYPEINIHLSVQANAVNWATVKFYEKLGLTRIILSRELSLEEIEEIRQHCPDIELEVFVHGALCMAYSGRCLLSGYINKRDSNQGTCTNACRWLYHMKPAAEDDSGNLIVDNGLSAMIAEDTNPNTYMGVFEDQHGTYIFNSKDLRAISLVEKLIKIGVDSLKIEGRTKSFYYVSRTAQIYRQAIDDALNGKPYNPKLAQDLESLANRGYTEGFLVRHAHGDYQNYEYGSSSSEQSKFVGEVLGIKNGLVEVAVKNHFEVGYKLLLMTPKKNITFVLEELFDDHNNPIKVALGDGYTVYFKIPEELDVSHGIVLHQFTGDQKYN